MTCVIKDNGKFYPQIILKEAFFKCNGVTGACQEIWKKE